MNREVATIEGETARASWHGYPPPSPVIVRRQPPSTPTRFRSNSTTTREVWVLRVLCAVSLAGAAGLLAGLLVVQKKYDTCEQELARVQQDKQLSTNRTTTSTTPTATASTTESPDNVHPPDYSDPDMFLSLSVDEINAVQTFLLQRGELNLTAAENATLSDNSIVFMELLLPPKKAVLAYLDNNSSKPTRWAEVTLLRLADATPTVQTVRVGPLPQATRYEDISSDSAKKYLSRPDISADYIEIDNLFARSFTPRQIEILRESFNATPSFANCTDRCFWLSGANVMDASQGGRRTWFHSGRSMVRTGYLFRMALNVEVDRSGLDPSRWQVKRIYYNGHLFQNLSHFEHSYTSDPSIRLRDHTDYQANSLFSTFLRRNNSRTRKRDRRPEPVQVNPGGHRFSVDGNHVSYMDWEFRYLVQAVNGLQLFDVRFDGHRIAYEISLQELFATYSGADPALAGITFFDSANMLGLQYFELVPGVDCPHSSVRLDVVQFSAGTPIFHSKNAICIFEWNTQLPLKRHYANNWDGTYDYYGGHSDTVLVVRTVAAVANYDYVIDYMFHLNGVIEVRTAATGYIWSSPYNAADKKYGHRLRDNLVGTLHTHLFNFKIDLDINGEENCFETLDIAMDPDTAAPFDPAEQIPQMSFTRNLRRTESDALISYNFDEPKYLLFYNRRVNNPYGIPRAYRLQGAPYGKLLLPENAGKDPAVSWARHQVVVTKRKDTESRSSSIYAFNNFDDPVINFTKFYADNEAIEQQDLVAWVTLGFHHLPHTEDLPTTSTVGTKANFMLLPYNYFDEDPSMVDNNLVYIEFDYDTMKPTIYTYADRGNSMCFNNTDLDQYDGTYFPND